MSQIRGGVCRLSAFFNRRTEFLFVPTEPLANFEFNLLIELQLCDFLSSDIL
jgi:hypothetical protein